MSVSAKRFCNEAKTCPPEPVTHLYSICSADHLSDRCSKVEFGISIIVTFYAIMRLIHDKPVVSNGGNRSTRRTPPPDPKSLTTFLDALAGIQTLAVVRHSSLWQHHRPHGHQGWPSVVRDSMQSVAMPWTTWPSGHAPVVR